MFNSVVLFLQKFVFLCAKDPDQSPIYKKGTKGEAGNYRPVSLTSIPCRILESLIKDVLMSHLLGEKLITENQHGFLKGRSCTTNLVIFMDKLTELTDKGKAADVCILP